MKAFGRMMSDTAKATNVTLMAINMKASSLMAKLMVKASTSGLTERSTTENGRMV